MITSFATSEQNNAKISPKGGERPAAHWPGESYTSKNKTLSICHFCHKAHIFCIFSFVNIFPEETNSRTPATSRRDGVTSGSKSNKNCQRCIASRRLNNFEHSLQRNLSLFQSTEFPVENNSDIHSPLIHILSLKNALKQPHHNMLEVLAQKVSFLLRATMSFWPVDVTSRSRIHLLP